MPLQWRHNEHNAVSNHQPHDCLLNRLFRRRSKKTSKLRVTGLCERNSSVTGEFPTQRASNAEKVSIWWRHHGTSPRAGESTGLTNTSTRTSTWLLHEFESEYEYWLTKTSRSPGHSIWAAILHFQSLKRESLYHFFWAVVATSIY